MSVDTKKTVSHAMIYAFGNILRNVVSIIMLPIYTRYLTPEDYGVVELLSMLIDFMTIILGMNLGDAIFRHYCMAEDKREKDSVITSALGFAAGLNGLGVLIVILLSGFLSEIMFGSRDYDRLITLFSWSMLLAVTSEICMLYIRVNQRPWTFVTFSLLKLVLQLGLNIYLVVVRDMHVEGVVFSALISGGIMTVLLLVYMLSKVKIVFSMAILRRLVSYSLPIMLAGIGAFYLTFGDRYFLRVFSGLGEVGIYSLGYKFGFILVVLAWDPFSKIWDSQKYEILEKDNAVSIYGKMFLIISLLLISAALLISLMVGDLLKVMSDPAFYEAKNIVPIILVAYIVQSWTSFSNFGILVKGNTVQITYGTIAAIVVVTIAYGLLIPAYGAYGAAWGTLAGFLVRLYWINSKAKAGYDMMLPWPKVLQLLAAANVVYLASFLIPDDFLVSVVLRGVLFLVYIAMLLMLPILSPSEKSILISVIRNPFHLKKVLL